MEKVKRENEIKPMKKLDEKDHKALAIWAADCAERVLHYFEERYPEDNRPRKAIEACREWARTGVFKMTNVRRDALAAHAAAREVGEDNAARSAARAAGQALAAAHVPTHALAAASYALQAVRRATDLDDAIVRERNWQFQHLPETLRLFIKAGVSRYRKNKT